MTILSGLLDIPVLHTGERRIVKKQRFSKNRALSNISGYTTARKKRSWFTDSDRGVQDVNQILRNKDYRREEMMRVASERLSKLEEKFEALTSAKNIERKLDREFELEQDPVAKDQKFDKMLSATRETIRKRSS